MFLDMDPFRKIEVMGIINLTDDSYYSGSRVLREDGKPDPDALLGKARQMADEGADILDIGACSSRPGAVPVSPREEWDRLEPALKMLRAEFPDLAVSIDTWRSDIVERVHRLIGPFRVNDISAGEDDPAMLETVGRLGLEYVAMHKRGTSLTMQSLTDYTPDPERPDLSPVTAAVLRYFRDFAVWAEKKGIRRWILDPGFGFAKTLEQNYQLLNELESLQVIGRDILVGISRKSMIYKRFGITPEEALPATQVLHAEALRRGASILRVHDVAEARRTVALYRELL